MQQVRQYKEIIPPLINACMNLSRTMRVFDTMVNPDLGGIEDTGILIRIKDIFPDKLDRYTKWQAPRAPAYYRRNKRDITPLTRP